MHLLNDFYEENKYKYNIFIIYINEAHAADVWNIGESAGAINYSHKKISDRIMYGNKFKNEFGLTVPVYCDNMENDFETKFASWPVRFFVLSPSDKKFLMISEPNDSEINICDLFDFLKLL